MGKKCVRGTCRDCKRVQPVNKVDFMRTSNPRCLSCGGMLDKGGPWLGARRPSAAVSAANISYPHCPTEFEIQAWLYCKLKELGFNVRGEVSADGNVCIFDLVLFDQNNRAKALIEVKKHESKRRSKQIRRYEDYGLPVVLIEKISGAYRLIEDLSVAKTFAGQPIEALCIQPS